MKKKTSEPWVIDNLKAFGNSLVPDELIEEYGIQTTEKIIAYALGQQVRIEERYPLVETGNELWGYTSKIREKPIYIAEVEKNHDAD